MVVGIDVFKAAFAGFEDQYTLIGGAAAEIHMTGAGLPFRATKDLDLVLCLEALKPEFVQAFWAFIDAGGYQTRERSDGARDFFRFTHPSDKTYPAMIELFSRLPDVITVPEGARLAPIPVDGTVESLSAMLLDDAYYALLKDGTTEVDGVPVIDVQTLISFKAFAYNNLARDRAEGHQVDSRNVTKHRNDVFKLLQLLGPAVSMALPEGIAADLRAFVEAVEADETFDPKALKLAPAETGQLVARLKAIYNLPLPLLFNFRSSPDLVAIQHVVARALDPSSPQVVAKTGKLIDGDVAQIWNSPTCAQETRHLATWLASDMTRRGRRPRDYAILVKQKAEAVDTELRAPMAASGLRIRNESALVGKVPLQDLLSDSLCRLVVAALRLGSVQRSPAAWQYLSAAISALRAIPPGDNAADARAEAALSRFLAGLRKDMAETPPSAEAAVNVAEAVLTFLDLGAVQRTYVEYGAGNLLEIIVEGLLQHLMASATGVSTWSECLDAFEGLDQIPLMTVHKSKGLEYDTIVFMGLDDQAWWAHKPGDKEGLAAFFVALSRAKQRAIFAFCQQRGQRSKVAELYALLGQAGVPEISI